MTDVQPQSRHFQGTPILGRAQDTAGKSGAVQELQGAERQPFVEPAKKEPGAGNIGDRRHWDTEQQPDPVLAEEDWIARVSKVRMEGPLGQIRGQ